MCWEVLDTWAAPIIPVHGNSSASSLVKIGQISESIYDIDTSIANAHYQFPSLRRYHYWNTSKCLV